MVLGAVVWLALAAAFVLWGAAVVVAQGAVLRPRSLLQWLLSAWTPRIVLLSFWAIAGWHVFCQRP
jgi:hypothetical protein